MCNITNQNFSEKYNEILREISNSEFIAIDCEFGGLIRETSFKRSLFDSVSENYAKFNKGSEDFIAFQIGITTFTYDKSKKYEASTYTFYLFPRPYSGVDAYFLCNANSIHFLARQNFDFNKVFLQGITYLRTSDEPSVKRDIKSGNLMWKLQKELSKEDRDVKQTICSQILEWSFTSESGTKRRETGETATFDVRGVEPFLVYLIREEVESRYPFLRTHRPERGLLKVEVTDDKVTQWGRLHKEQFTLASGFTKFLKEVIALKKPLVGHNLFSDLLFIYKMFIAPPPLDYEEYKKEIHRLFPVIYDTKYISSQVRKFLNKKEIWSVNTLPFLYHYFHEGRGKSIVPNMPVVEYKSYETPRSELSHDSGFDSYCTGFVFLKLAHIFTMWDPETGTFRCSSQGNGPSQCFGSVKDKCNKINIMNSYLDYISLDGPDPKPEKPDFYVMESLSGAIDIAKVTELISRHDRADIKPLTKRRALIAPTSNSTIKMLRKRLLKTKHYRITKYEPVSQSNQMLRRGAIALTLVGGIGIMTFLWYKSIRGTEDLWKTHGKLGSEPIPFP